MKILICLLLLSSCVTYTPLSQRLDDCVEKYIKLDIESESALKVCKEVVKRRK